MLVLLMLLFIGIELNVHAVYWIVWGIAFSIETINLFGSMYIETDDDEEEKSE